MRIHVAQQRAHALMAFYSRDDLRSIARFRGIPTGYSKTDLAVRLAFAGVLPPGYDKASER
jgi:hypothetical protein